MKYRVHLPLLRVYRGQGGKKENMALGGVKWAIYCSSLEPAVRATTFRLHSPGTGQALAWHQYLTHYTLTGLMAASEVDIHAQTYTNTETGDDTHENTFKEVCSFSYTTHTRITHNGAKRSGWDTTFVLLSQVNLGCFHTCTFKSS